MATHVQDAFPVIAIGASAGGVEALQQLFTAMPRTVDAAILVVLHMPAHSPSQLARVLAAVTGMPVSEACDGEPVRCGELVVCRPDHHLMVQDERVRTTRGPRECRMRPAVDVLFRSVAVEYGPRAVGIILSGMLDDGTSGLWTIKDRNGRTLVQSPEEARHPSMPESAIEHVQVDLVAGVRGLAEEIARLCTLPLALDPATPFAPSPGSALEARIAAEGNALELGVLGLGEQSKYACPVCHGVLMQIQEGSIVRFRCHTGHAFSAMTLLTDISEAVNEGLWSTIRALEERQLLLQQLSELSSTHGHARARDRYASEATKLQEHIRSLRSVAMSGDL